MTLAEIKEALRHDVLWDHNDTLEVFRALLGHLEAQERHIEMMDERLRLQTRINAEFMRILGVFRDISKHAPIGCDPHFGISVEDILGSSTNETAMNGTIPGMR